MTIQGLHPDIEASTDIAEDEDLLGKVVGDLQEDVTASRTAVTGTLKYVTGYTGFSGDVAEQSGNYLALKGVSETEGATIKVAYNGKEKTLDEDGIVIVRVSDKTKPLTFTAIKGENSSRITLDLSGLVLETE